MQTSIQTAEIPARSGVAAVDAIVVGLLVTFITALSVPAVRQARDDARLWHCRQQVPRIDASPEQTFEFRPSGAQILLSAGDSENSGRTLVPQLMASAAAKDAAPEPVVSDPAKRSVNSRDRNDYATGVGVTLAEPAVAPYCPDHSAMTFQVNGKSVTLLLGEARLCGGCVP